MDPESKGRAWFGKIYNKLETILVEVDNFAYQSTLCLKSSDLLGWESLEGEPEEVAEDRSSRTSDLQQHNDRIALTSCETPSDPPSQQNFDISGNVQVEERVEEELLKEDLTVSSLPDGEILSGAPLLQECQDDSLTTATTLGNYEKPIITDKESQITNILIPQGFSAGVSSVFPGEESVEEVRVESGIDFVSTVSQSTQSTMERFETKVTCNDDLVLPALEISMDDSNINPIATKIPDVPVQDNVANMRSCNPDDVIDGNYDVVPLDTKALYGIAFRENPSFVDDNTLYAVRVRTKKLRSFKRRILDALTSKRRREKDYEQLAIWFGDADIGYDLATGEDSKQMQAMDSKNSLVLKSEDSQWELL